MKKKIKPKTHNKPGQAAQNLSPDEALALNHTPGAVLFMKKLVRLILAGYQLTQAAQRLRKNYHYLLLTVTTLPEFKTYLAQLEQDYFSAFDRKIKTPISASARIKGGTGAAIVSGRTRLRTDEKTSEYKVAPRSI